MWSKKKKKDKKKEKGQVCRNLHRSSCSLSRDKICITQTQADRSGLTHIIHQKQTKIERPARWKQN